MENAINTSVIFMPALSLHEKIPKASRIQYVIRQRISKDF